VETTRLGARQLRVGQGRRPAGIPLLAALLLVWPTARGYAQDDASDLTVHLQALQADVLLHEPVYLRMTIENTSGTTLTVPTELDAATQTSMYAVSSDGGETWRTISPGYVREPVGDTITLKPGESYAYDQLLIWDGLTMTPVLPSPGTWQITAEVVDVARGVSVRSDTAQVEVEAPTGIEVAASDLFGTQEVINVAMNFGEPADAVAGLDRLIREFPDSRFSDYARYFLAQRQMEGYFDRKADPVAAVTYLEPLAAHPERALQIRPQALELLVRAYARSEDPGKALDTIRTILREQPGTPLAQRMAQQAEAFEKLVRERSQPAVESREPPGTREAAPAAPDTEVVRKVMEAEAARRAQPREGGTGPIAWVTSLAAVAALVVVGVVWLRRRRRSP